MSEKATEKTKAEQIGQATIEDLPVTAAQQDEVKGGGGVIVYDFVGAPIKRYK
jgi:hypothetical protein